jgi:histidine triad (HIT) family protein
MAVQPSVDNLEHKMTSCIFCSIAQGTEAADVVDESETLIAFHDKFPLTPVHVLIVAKEHISSADQIRSEHGALLAEVFTMAQGIARSEGTQDGYRVVTNVGRKGGQSVFHLHFHLLGGTSLGHGIGG